jgi:hypothetical protein
VIVTSTPPSTRLRRGATKAANPMVAGKCSSSTRRIFAQRQTKGGLSN